MKDPIPTSEDTPITSRNTRCTKTDDGNWTDLIFPTSQNTPISGTNSSKDDDANITDSTFPNLQDMAVRVNNDNNNGENLTDDKNEFEALKTFLKEELHHLRKPAERKLIQGKRDT